MRWHQARDSYMARNRFVDFWQKYWQAVHSNFRNQREKIEYSKKLCEFRYKRSISDYLVSLRELNYKVGSSGQLFHDVIRSHIPHEITDFMYQMGDIPE